MSFSQRLKLYGGLAGLLAAVLVLGIWFSPQALMERARQTPLLEQVPWEEIRSLSWSDLSLNLVDGVWRVRQGSDDFPADPLKVQNLLQVLKDIKVLQTVANDARQIESLNWVGEGMTLTRANGETLVWRWGQVRADGRSVFAQKAEGPILAVSSQFLPSMNQNLHQLSDLRVFRGAFTEAEINSVQLTAPFTLSGTTYAPFKVVHQVVQGQSQWVFDPEGGAADWKGALSRLPDLRGQENGLVNQSGFDQEAAQFIIETSRGSKVLSLGTPDGSNRIPASFEGRRYWITDWVLRDFLLTRPEN